MHPPVRYRRISTATLLGNTRSPTVGDDQYSSFPWLHVPAGCMYISGVYACAVFVWSGTGGTGSCFADRVAGCIVCTRRASASRLPTSIVCTSSACCLHCCSARRFLYTGRELPKA